MNGNKLKLNSNVSNCDNNANNELKIRFRNENDIFSRNPNRINAVLGGRRTPSPPKSQVLMSSNHLNSLPPKPMLKIQSLTKSCYTGWYSSQSQWSAQRLPTADRTNGTPECERKLKKLEQSGLLAKLANFNITKSVPLSLEEEEEEEVEDDYEDMDEPVFIDISKTNETIELKSSEEFEPDFVSQIKDEAKKVSSSSFSSQTSQKSCSQNRSVANDSTKRKRSSNGSRSQTNTAMLSKWQQKLTQITNKPSIVQNNQRLSTRRSKSNDNLVENNRDKQKPVLSRKSVDTLDTKSKERRSKSSEGRLSVSSSNKQSESQMNKSKNESQSRRSRSQSNVEQKPKNNEPKSSSNSSLTDNSNSSREKAIKKIKVNNKYYQILNCIGQGGSSRVYQVYDAERQMTLAIKVVDLSRADSLTVCGYKNEITLLSKLRECKRVVRMYDYEYQNNGQQLLVVMEKGDSDLSNVLNSFIESEGKRSLDSHLIRFYWQQMLKAVDEIHSYGVVHSDLKPVNFILVAGKLKLIDFGIANAIQANGTSVYKESQIGTINYMAPESLHNKSKERGKTVIKYNCKADVWSLGCILYNLVYGKTPFHDFDNLFQKANAIMDANYQIKYPPIDDSSLLDVMKLCLQRNPNKRPTTTELLNHRYLIESKPTKANDYQNALISQINNLTPNRIKQLSQVLEKLAKK